MVQRFIPLRESLAKLEQRINPGEENLHFTAKLVVSADDFENLGHIGSEALKISQEHWDHFLDDPYGAGHFWYDYMLVVSAASLAQQNCTQPAPVTLSVQTEVLEVLLGIRECMLRGWDTAKRSFEAIGNLMLAFKNDGMREWLREYVLKCKDEDCNRFLQQVTERVEGVEKRNKDKQKHVQDAGQS
jgi:hypothetical protein